MEEAGRAVGVALTMSEAAKACRVHRSTIRRHLFKQHFPNAYKESVNGWWRIPVADLEAAGLRPNRMDPIDATLASDRQGPAESYERLVLELSEAQRRAAEAQMRAAAAEALAQERLERIADLRMAFRALQAGSAQPDSAREAERHDEEEEHAPEPPARVRREPGTYQRIPVKDLTPAEEKEPDLISLALDAYKVFTPWRRRRT